MSVRKKETMVFSFQWIPMFELLDSYGVGIGFVAEILKYGQTGQIPEFKTDLEQLQFTVMKDFIDKSLESYEKTCRKNALSRANEWRKKNNLPVYKTYDEYINDKNNTS